METQRPNNLSSYLEQHGINLILTDVTLRDGLQTEPSELWPIAKKKDLFHEILSRHNPANIEVGSFVNPKVLPIMIDTLELFQYVEEFITKKRDEFDSSLSCSVIPDIYVLVPSAGKFAEAFANHVVNFSLITSVSESFQLKNTHKTLDQTKAELLVIDETLKSKTVYKKKLYISCIDECPVSGRFGIDAIVDEILLYCTQYNFDEICLSDTCGSLSIAKFKQLIEKLQHAGVSITRVGLHLHINPDKKRNLEQIICFAIHNGIFRFDVSHLVAGGCSVTLGEDLCHPNLTYEYLEEILLMTDL